MTTSIVIIIPALNEEITVPDVIRGCLAALDPIDFETSVYVVDDGSTDKTVQVSEQAGATVISHSVNAGVGRAFQTGLIAALESSVDIFVNIDADGQFDPADIPKLIEPILTGRADFTSASRFKDASLIPTMPKAKLIGNHLMSRLISKIARQNFHDVSCGFRAYSRETALQLNLWSEFTYTQESILDLAIKGLKIKEVPLKIDGVRKEGESRVASNLWRYGFRTLQIILHSYLDYWPLYFFGWISALLFVPGTALLLFLMVHRVTSGNFSPHIWAGFSGGSLFFLGIMTLITGLLGQILKRIRLNQERLLYYHRRIVYRKTSDT